MSYKDDLPNLIILTQREHQLPFLLLFFLCPLPLIQSYVKNRSKMRQLTKPILVVPTTPVGYGSPIPVMC